MIQTKAQIFLVSLVIGGILELAVYEPRSKPRASVAQFSAVSQANHDSPS